MGSKHFSMSNVMQHRVPSGISGSASLSAGRRFGIFQDWEAILFVDYPELMVIDHDGHRRLDHWTAGKWRALPHRLAPSSSSPSKDPTKCLHYADAAPNRPSFSFSILPSHLNVTLTCINSMTWASGSPHQQGGRFGNTASHSGCLTLDRQPQQCMLLVFRVHVQLRSGSY